MEAPFFTSVPGTMTSCRLPLVPSMMVTVCVPDEALAAVEGSGPS